MSELHDALVALTAMDGDARRAALTEHAGALFSEHFVAHVRSEQQRAASELADPAHAAWDAVPDLLADSFAEGTRLWAERTQAVWADMLELAQEWAASQPTAAPAASAAAVPTPSVPSSTAGVTPSGVVDTSPSPEEIEQDWVDWERGQYENVQESIEFNRIRDDAIDYSTPSYDSYSYNDGCVRSQFTSGAG